MRRSIANVQHFAWIKAYHLCMLDFAFCGSQLHDFNREGTHSHFIWVNWWSKGSYGFAKFHKSLVILFCSWFRLSNCVGLQVYTGKNLSWISYFTFTIFLMAYNTIVFVSLIKLVSALSQETYYTRKHLCCHSSETGVTSIKCMNFLHRRHPWAALGMRPSWRPLSSSQHL